MKQTFYGLLIAMGLMVCLHIPAHAIEPTAAGPEEPDALLQPAEIGLFQDSSDPEQRPQDPMTRGAFITALWRMSGSPQSAAAVPFGDISGSGTEFQSAISWAYEHGYICGYSPTVFAPGAVLTRQAAMKILFLHSGGQAGMETLFYPIYEDCFTDSGAMSDWASVPMYWAYYNTLISGTSDTTIGARDPLLRGQSAEILVKYIEKFNVV